jgi:hypothetical protein
MNNFHLAFYVHGLGETSFYSKDDPDKVNFSMHLVGVDETGSETMTPISHHTCTEDDFANFSPPHPNQRSKFEILKDHKKLVCIDTVGLKLIGGPTANKQ